MGGGVGADWFYQEARHGLWVSGTQEGERRGRGGRHAAQLTSHFPRNVTLSPPSVNGITDPFSSPEGHFQVIREDRERGLGVSSLSPAPISGFIQWEARLNFECPVEVRLLLGMFHYLPCWDGWTWARDHWGKSCCGEPEKGMGAEHPYPPTFPRKPHSTVTGGTQVLLLAVII